MEGKGNREIVHQSQGRGWKGATPGELRAFWAWGRDTTCPKKGDDYNYT